MKKRTIQNRAIQNRAMQHRSIQHKTDSITRHKFNGVFLTLFFSLILSLLSSPGWAKLTATVDRTVLKSNETLQLTVHYDGIVLTSKPNFDVLQRDFQVLPNIRSQSKTNLNVPMESYTVWQLTLKPKRLGKLQIPSIRFKQDISDTVEINVHKARPSNVAGQPVYIQTIVDKSTVYVQEQLLLTYRLYRSIELIKPTLATLIITDAEVQMTSQDQYQKRIGNSNYIVEEISYAVLPQASGKLNIPSITLSAYRARGNLLTLNTEPKTIDVIAKPDHIAADQWMPSSQLQLNQQWSSNLENWVVGEPITRTITIIAKGMTGAQIQPLSIEPSSDYKVYPDQPQLNNQVGVDGVTGIRRESFALVPNREGEIFLPEVTVHWWDTVNKRKQTATLDAIRLDVGPAPANSSTTVEPNLAAIDTPDISPAPLQSTEQQSLLESAQPSWLIQFSLGLNALLLALVAALLLKRPQPMTRKPTNNTQANSPRLKLKQQIKAIENAAAKEDLVAVRDAILTWGRCAFPEVKIKTLNEIAQRFSESPEPQLWEQFRLLDQNLYNSESSEKADIKLLIHLLKKLDTHSLKLKTSTNGLKPLYPTDNIG